MFDSDGQVVIAFYTQTHNSTSFGEGCYQLSSNGELLAIGSETGLVTLFDYTGNVQILVHHQNYRKNILDFKALVSLVMVLLHDHIPTLMGRLRF